MFPSTLWDSLEFSIAIEYAPQETNMPLENHHFEYEIQSGNLT